MKTCMATEKKKTTMPTNEHDGHQETSVSDDYSVECFLKLYNTIKLRKSFKTSSRTL